MKRIWPLLLIALVLAIVVAAGWWLRGESPAPDMHVQAVMPLPASGAAMTAPEMTSSLLPRDDVPLLSESADAGVADAVEALRQARLHGDPRAPAIERSAAPDAASPEELADPEAYQRYEARQNLRVYRDYVKAAESELPKLRAQVSAGRAGGLTPEQLREGEEKLRRIEDMRNQLLGDHPELSAPPP